MPHFGGRTQDASAPILGAGFWTKGKQLMGTVLRQFSTDNGECYVVKLIAPIEVNRNFTYPKEDKKEKLDVVSVGSLKGFGMALQSTGIPGAILLVGDKVQITCTGKSPSGKGNDQINFDVQVDRPDVAKENTPF
jgi:hypothetical protein